MRKTVRLDPAVGNISKEGLLLVAKATEVFMAVMAKKAWDVGKQVGGWLGGWVRFIFSLEYARAIIWP